MFSSSLRILLPSLGLMVLVVDFTLLNFGRSVHGQSVGGSQFSYIKLFQGRRLKTPTATVWTHTKTECASVCSKTPHCVALDVRYIEKEGVECRLATHIKWPVTLTETEERPNHDVYVEAGKCPRGYTHLAGSCYELNGQKMAQPSASLACEQYGGHLLELKEATERETIKSWINTLTTTGLIYDIWTSGMDISKSNSVIDFRWFPSNDVIPNNVFIHGTPKHGAGNGSACLMWRIPELKGHDANCSFRQDFVCEIDLD